MVEILQPGDASIVADDVKDRIVRFMRGASTEITPLEVNRLAELARVLPAGSVVYIAHTPKSSFEQVIDAAVAVQRAGFRAMPHIAARRIASAPVLFDALARLRAEGIAQMLLIAGDAPRALGPFASSMDILERGILQGSDILRLGVAGHPEGHGEVDSALLWQALQDKQALGARTGLTMHIVTQFGLDVGALTRWDRELVSRQIHLPVHVGIAGPVSVSKLIRFALQCGIGPSIRALTRGVGAAVQASTPATTADQHLLALAQMPMSSRFVSAHFFAFGGAVPTARWIQKITSGAFEIDLEAGRLRLSA